MIHFRITLLVVVAVSALLASCSTPLRPNYTSTNTEWMRVGGDRPADKSPEVTNLGAYCLQTSDRWKADGKTPDGESIWTKDTFRKAVECSR